jgi:predicted DNA-binding transcriptional regulator AlpA
VFQRRRLPRQIQLHLQADSAGRERQPERFLAALSAIRQPRALTTPFAAAYPRCRDAFQVVGVNTDHSNDVISGFVAEVRGEIARWGYVELDELPAMLGVSVEECQELIRSDDFPAPAMAGGRDVLPLWERTDIERWSSRLS